MRSRPSVPMSRRFATWANVRCGMGMTVLLQPAGRLAATRGVRPAPSFDAGGGRGGSAVLGGDPGEPGVLAAPGIQRGHVGGIVLRPEREIRKAPSGIRKREGDREDAVAERFEPVRPVAP